VEPSVLIKSQNSRNRIVKYKSWNILWTGWKASLNGLAGQWLALSMTRRHKHYYIGTQAAQGASSQELDTARREGLNRLKSLLEKKLPGKTVR
jgi:hypothetical protein